MRAPLLAFLTITLLVSSPVTVLATADDHLPRGKKNRGNARPAPGLQQAEINYEQAKILLDEAKLLVRDAQEQLDVIQAKKKQQQQQQRDGDSGAKPIRDYVPGLDEPREEEPHKFDGPVDDYNSDVSSGDK